MVANSQLVMQDVCTASMEAHAASNLDTFNPEERRLGLFSIDVVF